MKRSGMEQQSTLPEGKWDSVASQMVLRFKETGHPVFTSANALSCGILRMLKGKETTHFNEDASNTELLFRIIHFVNQPSIYGGVSNWCEQFGLTEDEKGTRKNSRQKRIREERNTEESEFTRSELFGIFSKSGIWKQLAEKHSGLRIAVRDCSVHYGLRRRIVLVQGIGWCELQDQT